jgi:hypothetical protein
MLKNTYTHGVALQYYHDEAVKTKQQRQLDSKSVCGRPLNSYDIFYILEPELLIQSKSKEGTATSYHRDHDAEDTSASVGPTRE